ncbi:hypothetical protein [Streptomyces sp. NPDC050149]|uniref:hypothetical protein n=1 Tax=unclassified Streptomyces TaxID=2593676 RepID=UPI00379F360E
MMYNLLAAGAVEPAVLTTVLASTFNVNTKDVDVADHLGDVGRRNWEAAVSCEYSALRGDLSWSLEIYAQKSVSAPPPESMLAQRVAAGAGVVVLFPAMEDLPSAYWAATPEGNVTRVRLDVSDDEAPVYVVDAMESPVRQLPHAKIMRIPEVVRELKIPTPVTDSFNEHVPAHSLTQESPEWQVWDCLGAWERLVAHMASGWAGSGWCPPDLYRERLTARDGLAGAVPDQLPPTAAAVLQQGLQRLDSTYAHLTAEDQQGLLIGLLLGSQTQSGQLGWWWHRRPEPLPW